MFYIAGKNVFAYPFRNKTMPPLIFSGHSDVVLDIGSPSYGRWLWSISTDKSLRIWEIGQAVFRREYKHPHVLTACTMMPNQSSLMTGDDSGNIYLWDLNEDGLAWSLTLFDSDTGVRTLSSTSIDGQNYIVVANRSGLMWLYKMVNDSRHIVLIQELTAHRMSVLRVKFSPDGRWLATTGADGACRLWSFEDERLTLAREIDEHDGWVWSCCFSQDGNYLATCGSDTKVFLWSVPTCEKIKEYVGHKRDVTCVALC